MTTEFELKISDIVASMNQTTDASGNPVTFSYVFESKNGANYFLYDFMQSELFKSIINEITIGSTQNAITISAFGQQKIIFPNDTSLKIYINNSMKLNKAITRMKSQNVLLNSMKDLLLSKLATIEKY